MAETIETVKIKADSKSGFRIINKSDMKDGDVIYKEKAPEVEKTEAPETEAEAPETEAEAPETEAEAPKKQAKKKASKKS